MPWTADDEEINGVIDANLKSSPPNPPAVNTSETVKNLFKAYWSVVRGQVQSAIEYVDLTNSSVYIQGKLAEISAAASFVETKRSQTEVLKNQAQTLLNNAVLGQGLLGDWNAATNTPTLSAVPPAAPGVAVGSYYEITTPAATAPFTGSGFTSGVTPIDRGRLVKKSETQWLYAPPSSKALEIAQENKTRLPEDFTDVVIPLTVGYYNRTTGAYSSSISYKCAEIIYLAGERIKVSGATNGSPVALATYINASNAVISSQFPGANGIETPYTEIELTVPAGTVKILVGSTFAYPLEVKKLKPLIAISTNLADTRNTKTLLEIARIEAALNIGYTSFSDPVVITGSYYKKEDASIVTNSGYKRVEIVFAEGDSYKVTGTITGSAIALIIYVNAAGLVLSAENPGTNGVDTAYVDFQLTIPKNTAKILVSAKATPNLSFKKLTISKIQSNEDFSALAAQSLSNKNRLDITEPKIVNLETKSTDSQTRLTSVEGRLPEGFKISDLVVNEGKYYNRGSGVLTTNAAYRCAEFPYSTGEIWRATGVASGGATALAIYINAENAVIGTQLNGVNGVDNVYTEVELVIPATTVKILINSIIGRPIYVEKFQKLIAGSAIDIQKLVDRLNNITVKSYWFAKSIVWFGTSIPATGYPQLIAALLGATIYNEAVGSSMARRGKIQKVAGDPYGWDGLAWQNVFRSLSQTLAEKNELINNWETWKTKLTNSPPDILSTADTTQLLDCSFENKLNRHLGPGNRRDLYVFDHGHNDNLVSDSDTQFKSVPADSRDRDTFIGAHNFLIDKILTDNPRARICFIGHYENARKTRISEAQEILAEYWDFPILKLWTKLGWSQQIIPTTGYWSDSTTWNESGGASVSKTITQIWMQDDLHPNSLPAKTLIANAIATFLETVR